MLHNVFNTNGPDLVGVVVSFIAFVCFLIAILKRKEPGLVTLVVSYVALACFLAIIFSLFRPNG
jgi:hypothetical protein